MAKIKRWNGNKLLARTARILTDFEPRIAAQLQNEIAKEQFQWPVTTLRKNGRIVEAGPRDIVDTGLLIESQTPGEVIGGGGGVVVLQIAWNAPYSGEVLRGGYLVGSLRDAYTAPARDWISPALMAQPPRRFFIARWKELASGNSPR